MNEIDGNMENIYLAKAKVIKILFHRALSTKIVPLGGVGFLTEEGCQSKCPEGRVKGTANTISTMSPVTQYRSPL